MDAEPAPAPPKRPRAELLYAWEGKITLPTVEEWRAMDKGVEDDMLNGPIVPPAYRELERDLADPPIIP